MEAAAHARRTTVVFGLVLVLVLVVVAVAVARLPTRDAARPEPTPASSTPTPIPTPQAVPPQQGPAYPVRTLGALADRSVIVEGRGNADLRYRRAPHEATRLHFICTGCDADTWLAEQPRGGLAGRRPLPDPGDATAALDTARPASTTNLLVKAPARGEWTVILTPFDAIPVHRQTFDALGDDVVAVRAVADLRISCGGAASVETLARASGADEYAVVQQRSESGPGSWPVTAPAGSDLLIMVVSCPGRWTVTLP